MLGMFVTLEYSNFVSWLKKNKAYIIAGYILLGALYTIVSFYDMVIYSYVWFLFSTVSILFVYYVGLQLKSNLIKLYGFIKIFGQSSYYIYLMHPLILTLMIIFTTDMGILSVTKKIIIYFIVVIPFTVTLCLIYTAVKNKIKDSGKKKATA